MIDERQLIKEYEKITKSTNCGRLGNSLAFRKKNGKYYFITIDQIKEVVRKEGK